MAHTEPCACCGSDAGDDSGDDTTGLTQYCPPGEVIDTIRRKYAIQIVALLGDEGSLRYGEIKDRVGAPSDATMSRRLEQLAADDLIARQHYDEIPPRVEYTLTPTGRELADHLHGLLEWADGVDAR